MIAVAREPVVLSITMTQSVGTDDSIVIAVAVTALNTAHSTAI
jgi:hypothetical protein